MHYLRAAGWRERRSGSPVRVAKKQRSPVTQYRLPFFSASSNPRTVVRKIVVIASPLLVERSWSSANIDGGMVILKRWVFISLVIPPALGLAVVVAVNAQASGEVSPGQRRLKVAVRHTWDLPRALNLAP